MAITSVPGPQVCYGVTLSSSGVDFEHNPDRGPSFSDLGEALMDPRPPFCFTPGQASSHAFFGWAGLFGGPVVDQSPSATSTNNIALTQVPAGGTALTLSSLSSLGFGAAVTINAYEGGTVSIRPIDGAMTGLAFGVSGGANIWNPQTAVSRTISICGSSNGSTAEAWSIAGRDIYGQKMTELVIGSSTGSTGTGVQSKKAYKYISSIVPSTVNGAIGSTNVTVGSNDVFGFPLRVDHPGYLTCWAGPASSATLVNISTGAHTFAVTSAASNTTGDVRGTIATSGVAGSVSNASNWKIVMFISPSAQNLQAMSVSTAAATAFIGLVGLTQFSSV